jgi:hypothetical protein
MARWRAVPTAVSTAVGALAFLASAGLAVVLGAGLHVWSGPTTPGALGGQAQPGSVSVTNRVGGVVTVQPPAPPQPHTGASAPGSTPSLPFIPFVPPTPVAAPPAAAPAVPPTTHPVTTPSPLQRGARHQPLTLRAFLHELRGARSTIDDLAGLRALRPSSSGPALRSDETARPGPHAHARGPHGKAHGKGHGHRHGAHHHHPDKGARHHGHPHHHAVDQD